jgi:release factor glutamine methyltransferase
VSGDFTGLSVETARRHLSKWLRNHAIDTPELDARLLVGAVLDLDLTGLAVAATRCLKDTEAERLFAVAQRRIAGEPVARIVGVKEFWGLPFKLSAATLVPRPDTETLVQAALALISRKENTHSARSPLIADLGTGSGAILLALLSEIERAWGVGTDIDAAALWTAADNARRLGLGNRAGFVRCNYAQALKGPFDIIVSNPPYIPTRDVAALDIEVREHDPLRALDGGPDGLDAYRALVPQAAGLLRAGGALLVEVGQHQSDDVGRLMEAAGLTGVPAKADLAGIPRVVIGRK